MNESTTENAVPAIDVKELSHSYRNHRALVDISFSVPQGAIHGFVGANGAGKTTTLKVLATLIRPQHGLVRVMGLEVRRAWKRVRSQIGYMPDHFSMYRQMSVFEYLDFFAAAYGLTLAKRNQVVDQVLNLVDLDGRRNDRIRTLSRGMMQRVSLARVLVNDPAVLLLDEPASGLDPRARIELMEILRELCNMGKTVFISSHILSELADLCDSVTIVDRGTVRYSGPIGDLLRHEGESHRYVVELEEEVPSLAEALLGIGGITEVEAGEGAEVLVAFDSEQLRPADIVRAVLERGGLVSGFREDRRHLNQVFLDLTEPGVR